MAKIKRLNKFSLRTRWHVFRNKLLGFFFPITTRSIRNMAYIDGVVDQLNRDTKIIHITNKEKSKEKAIEILNLFEELLDEHHINIPDPLRNGEEGEAHLYGEAYYKLEDEIFGIIQK